jgi:hypothetical protein
MCQRLRVHSYLVFMILPYSTFVSHHLCQRFVSKKNKNKINKHFCKGHLINSAKGPEAIIKVNRARQKRTLQQQPRYAAEFERWLGCATRYCISLCLIGIM